MPSRKRHRESADEGSRKKLHIASGSDRRTMSPEDVRERAQRSTPTLPSPGVGAKVVASAESGGHHLLVSSKICYRVYVWDVYADPRIIGFTATTRRFRRPPAAHHLQNLRKASLRAICPTMRPHLLLQLPVSVVRGQQEKDMSELQGSHYPNPRTFLCDQRDGKHLRRQSRVVTGR